MLFEKPSRMERGGRQEECFFIEYKNHVFWMSFVVFYDPGSNSGQKEQEYNFTPMYGDRIAKWKGREKNFRGRGRMTGDGWVKRKKLERGRWCLKRGLILKNLWEETQSCFFVSNHSLYDNQESLVLNHRIVAVTCWPSEHILFPLILFPSLLFSSLPSYSLFFFTSLLLSEINLIKEKKESKEVSERRKKKQH